HISSLSVLPFVFIGALLWMRNRNPAWLALSAIAAALVVTNNFYGATALAISFPILVWACFVARPGVKLLASFASIAALAYGLTAWWLVPSYLKVTSENLKLVAEPGTAWSVGILVATIAVFAA